MQCAKRPLRHGPKSVALLDEQGKTEEALAAYRQGVELGEGRYNVACMLSVLDRSNEAIEELKLSLEAGEVTCSFVLNDPDWEKLKDDPRFPC